MSFFKNRKSKEEIQRDRNNRNEVESIQKVHDVLKKNGIDIDDAIGNSVASEARKRSEFIKENSDIPLPDSVCMENMKMMAELIGYHMPVGPLSNNNWDCPEYDNFINAIKSYGFKIYQSEYGDHYFYHGKGVVYIDGLGGSMKMNPLRILVIMVSLCTPDGINPRTHTIPKEIMEYILTMKNKKYYVPEDYDKTVGVEYIKKCNRRKSK